MDLPDVVWTTPSSDEHGSMPIGNGEVAANVWTEDGRDLVAYLARTDAWDENGRLCKLGRIRVRLPAGSLTGEDFRQHLDLATATIRITTASHRLEVWVDAHHPVLRISVSGHGAFPLIVTSELWRRSRTITGIDEMFGWIRQEPPFETVTETPDDILAPSGETLAWCHHNRSSCWRKNLVVQGLGGWADEHPDQDPLLGNTFGCLVSGTGLRRSGELTLAGSEHVRYEVAVVAHTARAASPAAFLTDLETIRVPSLTEAAPAHAAWWQAFWSRSWIRISGDAAAAVVDQAYCLQRFLFAAAGRGRFPIKFNGSLFTVRGLSDGKAFGRQDGLLEDYGPDWRRWGGGYWFQNTRLAYWPMVMSGDADCAQALFRMYQDCLPLARARTAAHHHHAGVTMPETTTFWGTWGNVDYGYPEDRARCLAGNPRRNDHHPLRGAEDGSAICGYLRHHFSGALELVALGLDLHATSGDEAFLRTTLLPLAREYLTFYRAHWQHRGPDGTLVLWPAQALETWQEATNPLPEIAALRWVLARLLALPGDALTTGERDDWTRWLAELPAMPTRLDGERHYLPATAYDLNLNCENPELYAVFPFRFAAVGTPDLALGRATYTRRRNRMGPDSWIKGGWFQDPIQAAMLGLGREARDLVAHLATTKDPCSRFPAFWGPNFDWVPDQDHGGVLMIALQRMVMHAEPGRLELLPAWPAEWNVDFRLHAPGGRVVSGRWADGAWHALDVPQAAGEVVAKHSPCRP
jgi:alpha-L-fucosidase 2